MDRPGVCQVLEGSGEQGRMEETGCKISCGAPTTLAVKGLTVMMVMMKARSKQCFSFNFQCCGYYYYSISIYEQVPFDRAGSWGWVCSQLGCVTQYGGLQHVNWGMWN